MQTEGRSVPVCCGCWKDVLRDDIGRQYVVSASDRQPRPPSPTSTSDLSKRDIADLVLFLLKKGVPCPPHLFIISSIVRNLQLARSAPGLLKRGIESIGEMLRVFELLGLTDYVGRRELDWLFRGSASLWEIVNILKVVKLELLAGLLLPYSTPDEQILRYFESLLLATGKSRYIPSFTPRTNEDRAELIAHVLPVEFTEDFSGRLVGVSNLRTSVQLGLRYLHSIQIRRLIPHCSKRLVFIHEMVHTALWLNPPYRDTGSNPLEEVVCHAMMIVYCQEFVSDCRQAGSLSSRLLDIITDRVEIAVAESNRINRTLLQRWTSRFEVPGNWHTVVQEYLTIGQVD